MNTNKDIAENEDYLSFLFYSDSILSKISSITKYEPAKIEIIVETDHMR